MSYTVSSASQGVPVSTVAPSVIDALRLVREIDDADGVTIASDTGWILTPDQLEALAKP